MSVSVVMPQLGESVTEGTVTRWLKKEGEHVKVDEPLLEVSTDKVDTEIPSPATGVLRGLAVDEDETVAVQLAVIENGGAAARFSAPEPPAAAPAPSATPAPEPESKPAPAEPAASGWSWSTPAAPPAAPAFAPPAPFPPPVAPDPSPAFPAPAPSEAAISEPAAESYPEPTQ